VATVLAFFVALGLNPWKAAAVGAFGIAMYVADSTAISTKIYGEILRLPLFIVLLALFLGGALMGVWGALIATPVAAAIDLVIRDHLSRAATPEPAEAHVATPRPRTGNSERSRRSGPQGQAEAAPSGRERPPPGGPALWSDHSESSRSKKER
jgi:hypothetical protein